MSAGNEVSDGAEWAVAGVNIAGRTISVAVADVVMLDGNDTASGASATLAAVFGCLVYDDTIAAPVADQGFCTTTSADAVGDRRHVHDRVERQRDHRFTL